MPSNYVFNKKVKEPLDGFPILYLLNKPHVQTSGQIGIEVECEGNKFQKNNIPSPWKYTEDHSLRGADNAEYVLRNPIPFDKVDESLDILWKMMSDYGTVLDESNRTSVHVHLNVQQWHLNRLCTFFGLYFLIEELLTAWCGDHRIGNLFCLRAKDAPAIISEIKRICRTESIHIDQGYHYAGMNAHALTKYGSVEIRSLKGCTDKSQISQWVSVLRRLYDLSGEIKDPRQVVENFSGNGPISYLQELLGDSYDTIINNIPYTQNDVINALYDGVRLAQDICYCRDWSKYQPKDIKDDPFGRSKTKIAKSLMGSPGMYSPNLLQSAENLIHFSNTLNNSLNNSIHNAATWGVEPFTDSMTPVTEEEHQDDYDEVEDYEDDF